MKLGDRVAVYNPQGEKVGKGVLRGLASSKMMTVANNELTEVMAKVKLDAGYNVYVNRKMLRRLRPRAR